MRALSVGMDQAGVQDVRRVAVRRIENTDCAGGAGGPVGEGAGNDGAVVNERAGESPALGINEDAASPRPGEIDVAAAGGCSRHCGDDPVVDYVEADRDARAAAVDIDTFRKRL